MSYQVLARKWRPKTFAELAGQEHVVTALTNALARGRLHHAYLLTGTRGIGKTTIARILAKSLNCVNGVTPTPCGVCPACVEIDAGRFVDLLELDAASNTGIDNMRDILDNARRAAERSTDEMIAKARSEIQSERDRLRREIETARDQALQELWNQAAQLATLISAKAIGRSLTEEDHRRLLDEAIAELGQSAQRR